MVSIRKEKRALRPRYKIVEAKRPLRLGALVALGFIVVFSALRSHVRRGAIER